MSLYHSSAPSCCPGRTFPSPDSSFLPVASKHVTTVASLSRKHLHPMPLLPVSSDSLKTSSSTSMVKDDSPMQTMQVRTNLLDLESTRQTLLPRSGFSSTNTSLLFSAFHAKFSELSRQLLHFLSSQILRKNRTPCCCNLAISTKCARASNSCNSSSVTSGSSLV